MRQKEFIVIISSVAFSIVSLFALKLDIFGMIVLVPTLLFFPGYLTVDFFLTLFERKFSYKSNFFKLEKIVLSITLSFSITIILSLISYTIQKKVSYQTNITVIAIYNLIWSSLLIVFFILTHFKENNSLFNIKIFFSSFSNLSRGKAVSSMTKLFLLLFIITILFLPIFFVEEPSESYSFSFFEFPPHEINSSVVKISIKAQSFSTEDINIVSKVYLNTSLYFRDSFFLYAQQEKYRNYTLSFADDGLYFVLIEFFNYSNGNSTFLGKLNLSINVTIEGF